MLFEDLLRCMVGGVEDVSLDVGFGMRGEHGFKWGMLVFEMVRVGCTQVAR